MYLCNILSEIGKQELENNCDMSLEHVIMNQHNKYSTMNKLYLGLNFIHPVFSNRKTL